METDSELLSKFSNIYIMLLMAIMTKDMNRIKAYLSKDMYYKYCQIVKQLNENHENQVYDELNVHKIEIINKNKMDNKEIIKVRLISKYMDYIVDENGNYKKGENTHRVEKTNILTFEKEIGYSQKNVYQCEHCGANLDIHYTGVCQYCNSIVDVKIFEYILVNME